ncbi:uncharacterized protein LOC131425310 [Malaya genurostris]|uniref:uncharacterized protein LOC131425310 n=1 Tax=Malaya genurostris TaxID=325434 RepID=UPI0026F3DCC6|nr:uncharacterized protein LOC131425310 [Malaya genurostris]
MELLFVRIILCFALILVHCKMYSLATTEHDSKIHFPNSDEEPVSRFGSVANEKATNSTCTPGSNNKPSKKGFYIYDADAKEWVVTILRFPSRDQDCSHPELENASADEGKRIIDLGFPVSSSSVSKRGLYIYDTDSQQWTMSALKLPTAGDNTQSGGGVKAASNDRTKSARTDGSKQLKVYNRDSGTWDSVVVSF